MLHLRVSGPLHGLTPDSRCIDFAHVSVALAYQPGRSRFYPAMSAHASPAPPRGGDWLHEIKHDGYRMIARRDGAGIRLLTRNGYDLSPRYLLVVEAINALKIRTCI